MKPENKFQSFTLSVATLIVFGIWVGLTKLPDISDWLKILVTGLTSFGVYKIVVVFFSSVMRKFRFIKKFVLGPYYLEGTWVGFYIGVSDNVRYFIESFEQEIDSLVIRGKSFNENLGYHSTWTTDITNIDIKKGKLTYLYDVDSIRDISNNVGIASFKFERENQYKPPIKMMGFAADLHLSKKIKAIEIKVEENLSDIQLLERARNFYEENKNCF